MKKFFAVFLFSLLSILFLNSATINASVLDAPPEIEIRGIYLEKGELSKNELEKIIDKEEKKKNF